MERFTVAIKEENEELTLWMHERIDSDPNFTLVGSAHNEDELLQIIREKHPDVLLMDSAVQKLYMGQRFKNSIHNLMREEAAPYRSYSRDPYIDAQTTALIQRLGIPAHLKGYQYLRDAIGLVSQDSMMLESVTKLLYPTVARMHNTTSVRVERAIRHAIEHGWSRSKPEILEQYFGFTINMMRGKPTNSEFIAIAADRIRLNRVYS